MPDHAHKHTNRLAHESSPYLLQHAHNPVDWRPWSDDAFAEAQQRQVPVFLSIGYSTCYWCHVMERESFEKESIARLLNERFVCIKVDREERPDIDDLYMAATQIFSGSGGWPMNVFLEPNTRRPFWCGTYFPPEPMHGRPAFPDILRSLSDAFADRRAEVDEQGEKLAAAVAEQLAPAESPVAVGLAQVTRATGGLLTQVDRVNGGFGGAPKFPQPIYLEYLLDTRARADEPTARAIDAAVRKTLDAMALGGIFDHAGGGFHRYSVDATWTVPHFEKMLYDNAQLARLYARAARVYDDELYRRVARRTFDYALREMHTDAAGFFSAEDAEVDGREGLNYLWTPEELRETLADEADWAMKVYAVDRGPNFRDPHHPDEPMRSVLRLDDHPAQLAAAEGTSPEQWWARLDAINEQLRSARAQRKQPGLDDKSITSWNAMMVSALVTGAEALNEPRYMQAAERTARFLRTHMRTSDGRLARVARAGKVGAQAPLEDHAYLIDALLAIHRSPMRTETGDTFLDDARTLLDEAHERFADGDARYHDTDDARDDLFVRARSTYDGAVPSGIGVMLGNLVTMARIDDDPRWAQRAMGLLAMLSPAIARSPISSINAARHLLTMLALPELFNDPELLSRAAEPDSGVQAPGMVGVFVSSDEIEVSDDTPGVFELALEIPEGFHIVAADPGRTDLGLIPLRVGLISGQGIAVYAEYPEGEPLGVESVGRINTNSGRVEFTVALEKAPGVGPSPGEPILGVSFQACSDTACRPARTVELKVAVSVV